MLSAPTHILTCRVRVLFGTARCADEALAMKTSPSSRSRLVVRTLALATLTSSPLQAVPQTWDNSSGDAKWFTATNWNNDTRPDSASDLTFPAGPGGTINLDSIPGPPSIVYPTANSLQFDSNYTLSGSELTLSGGQINVTGNSTATLSGTLTTISGMTKTGTGTLVLSAIGGPAITISAGTVRPTSTTALGLGPVTFANPAGVAAGINFGTLTGTFSGNLDLTGSGDATFTSSASAPNTLTLGGNIDTSQKLIFDVVNGTVVDNTSATLSVSGVIDDGAGTIGIVKRGNGLLKLAAGNTYSGSTTIEKGTVAITADSALGDSTAPLIIDGGCLQTTFNPVLGRNLSFTANGGTLRSLTTLEIPGQVDWGSGTVGFIGSGRTIVSGTTAASSANLQLGLPTAFATTSTGFISNGHTLSLRGTASLPGGNISIDNNCVLELGNSNFTRSLGSGPGQAQIVTAIGAGWAAYGADRIVNIGGAGAPLVWGAGTQPFLYRNVPGNSDFGKLILGSFTATHTVEFQNPLIFPTDSPSTTVRQIACWDGAAAIDGRITGDMYLANPLKYGSLNIGGDGTLEISGNLLTRFFVTQDGQGTTILSGNNTGLTLGITVFMGKLVIANDSALGTSNSIAVFDGEFDVSSMTVPAKTRADGQFIVGPTAIVRGDVEVNGYLQGSGEITGDLTVPAASDLVPDLGGMLRIGGNLDLQSSGALKTVINGLVPEFDYTRLGVTGTVDLAGNLEVTNAPGLVENDSFVLLLNDGDDPIVGTFAGLPEGAGIPIGNGLAMKVTYLANGDGGAVGNDFGITVVAEQLNSDINLHAAASVAVDLGGDIPVSYVIQSPGPGEVNDAVLDVTLPPNATLATPLEAGWSINSGILSIPLPVLGVPDTAIIDIHFTAPLVTSSVVLVAHVHSSLDLNELNNHYTTTTAVLPGGSPVITGFTRNATTGDLEFGIDTISGVRYVLESSVDLGETGWEIIETIDGDGNPYVTEQSTDDPSGRDFFRFRIVPNNGGGGNAS